MARYIAGAHVQRSRLAVLMAAPLVMASASAASAAGGIVAKELCASPGDVRVDGGGRQDGDEPVIVKTGEAIRNFIESK